MSDFDFPDTLPGQVDTIALFPLGLVLYPGSWLELRIFEPRYHAMIAECLAANSGFGIVRIEQGGESMSEPDARQPAISPVGTFVQIVHHQRLPSEHRLVRVQAGRRFEVLTTHEQPNRLLMGRVSWLEDEEVAAIPPKFANLVETLRHMVSTEPRVEHAIDFEDASQVSWWLTRLKVRDVDVGQQILSQNNPLDRLEYIDRIIALEGAP